MCLEILCLIRHHASRNDTLALIGQYIGQLGAEDKQPVRRKLVRMAVSPARLIGLVGSEARASGRALISWQDNVHQ